MTTSTSLSADNLIYKHFIDTQNGRPVDWQQAKAQAAESALKMLRAAADQGLSVGELLVVLHQANSVVGEEGRAWVSSMIDFIKFIKPILESAKNRFVPGSEKTVVGYDDNLKIAVQLWQIARNGLGSESTGLRFGDVFDADKRQLVINASNDHADYAINALQNGGKLDNNDRMKLQTLFSMTEDALTSLNQRFGSVGGDVGADGKTVQIDEQALSANATRLSSSQQQVLNGILDDVRNLPNLGSFLR